MFNLWIWESGWRVLATYETAAEAHAAGKHSADPPDTWTVARMGSEKDEYMRQHISERMAQHS